MHWNESIFSTHFHRLGLLLTSGVALLPALRSLSATETGDFWRKAMLSMQQGQSLSSAFAKAPSYWRMCLEAGESSGKLGDVLLDLADYLAQRLERRQKLWNILTYPIFLTTVIVASLMILTQTVVPALRDALAEQGVLPSFLLRSLTVLGNWKTVFGLAGTLVVFIWVYPRFWQHWPWAKQWRKVTAQEEFFGLMALLVQSGVPLLRAIGLSSQMSPLLSADQMSRLLQEGQTVWQTLQKVGIEDPFLIQLVESGEKVGRLAEVLSLCHKHLARENAQQLRKFLRWLEPSLVGLLALVVAGLFSSILGPLMQLGDLNSFV